MDSCVRACLLLLYTSIFRIYFVTFVVDQPAPGGIPHAFSPAAWKGKKSRGPATVAVVGQIILRAAAVLADSY